MQQDAKLARQATFVPRSALDDAVQSSQTRQLGPLPLAIGFAWIPDFRFRPSVAYPVKLVDEAFTER